jgi:hypothetical protein
MILKIRLLSARVRTRPRNYAEAAAGSLAAWNRCQRWLCSMRLLSERLT